MQIGDTDSVAWISRISRLEERDVLSIRGNGGRYIVGTGFDDLCFNALYGIEQ
jgi:hypothetical protein